MCTVHNLINIIKYFVTNNGCLSIYHDFVSLHTGCLWRLDDGAGHLETICLSCTSCDVHDEHHVVFVCTQAYTRIKHKTTSIQGIPSLALPHQ